MSRWNHPNQGFKKGHKINLGKPSPLRGRHFKMSEEAKKNHRKAAHKGEKAYNYSGGSLLSTRREKLKARYGITLQEYADLVRKQKGKCIICRRFCKRLDIDHCHKTNKVRGLLCNSCNRALGYLKDNILNLARAIEYLRKNQTKFKFY